MHDIKWIRDNPDASTARWSGAGSPAEARRADRARRAPARRHREAEAAQARRNAASREIGAAKKSDDQAAAEKLMAEVAALKEAIPALEAEEKDALQATGRRARADPESAARRGAGRQGRDDNVEHHRFGAKRDYAFTPKQHFELGEALGQMDFETAAKLSGARFVVLKGGLARLERALGQFMLDVHTSEHGYTEVEPPLLVRDEVMFGTAQLPKFEDDQFLAPNDIAARC